MPIVAIPGVQAGVAGAEAVQALPRPAQHLRCQPRLWLHRRRLRCVVRQGVLRPRTRRQAALELGCCRACWASWAWRAAQRCCSRSHLDHQGLRRWSQLGSMADCADAAMRKHNLYLTDATGAACIGRAARGTCELLCS